MVLMGTRGQRERARTDNANPLMVLHAFPMQTSRAIRDCSCSGPWEGNRDASIVSFFFFSFFRASTGDDASLPTATVYLHS